MPERNCEGCTRQDEWGCTAFRWRTPAEGEPDGPENWVNPAYLPVTLSTGDDSYACPRQDLREDPRGWGRMFLLYQMFSKGHLPDKGAVVDQSNVLLESFRILDEANRECDKAEADKAAAQRNRQGRKGPRTKG